MVLLRKKDNNFLVACRDKILIYSLKTQESKLVNIPEPNLPENLSKGQIEVLKKETRNITALDFSEKNGSIVVSTENKQVVVFDDNYDVIKNFIVNRAASKVCFTPTNDILVADKTGDVYLYNLNSDKDQPQLLLGHLSVILDMTLSECGKYIITCDRDEKIRVSCFPNAYNIVSFCLGHTEFVTSVKLVKDILVSASGDGTVRFWKYLESRQLGIINTNEYVTESTLLEVFAKQMDKEKVDITALPVTDMQICCKGATLYVVVSLHCYNSLQVYKTDLSTFKSDFVMKITVSDSLLCYYLSEELYVLSDKFSVFKFTNERFVESDVCILANFYEKYKDILKQSDDSGITVLYKRKFDNVQEYLERKRQRLEGK